MENFDFNEVIENLSKYSNEKLCEIIICERYLGVFKEISIQCMEELGKRRINGDLFNFEEYIENEFKNLPKIEPIDLSGLFKFEGMNNIQKIKSIDLSNLFKFEGIE